MDPIRSQDTAAPSVPPAVTTPRAIAAARLTVDAPKVLLYSHDTVGLGNIRRTLLVSETIVGIYPRASLLIVTGSPVMHAFRIPERTDYIKLPCLDRTDADSYQPTYLGSRGSEVAQIRRGILERCILGFAPDLMIVDKRPAGIGGELLATLQALGSMPARPRLVLGMRDILDEPTATRDSLERTRDLATIARYYDEVWIYGEREVFDAVSEYAFPEAVARKTCFCGYLKRDTRPRRPRQGPPRVLVTTGGGVDGAHLIETYLTGVGALPRSVALHTTVVFGPQLSERTKDTLLQRFGALPDVRFLEFQADLTSCYAEADIAVSMAGYNTVCELLSFNLPAVLVPRISPVREQLVRARLFAARGLFDCVEPGELTPEGLVRKVLALHERPRQGDRPISVDGLSRVRARVEALLRSAAARGAHA